MLFLDICLVMTTFVILLGAKLFDTYAAILRISICLSFCCVFVLDGSLVSLIQSMSFSRSHLTSNEKTLAKNLAKIACRWHRELFVLLRFSLNNFT